MKIVKSSHRRTFRIPVAPTIALFGAALLSGQDTTPAMPGGPEDWTHHALVFSNPGTAQDAVQNGTYRQWLQTVSSPRYALQRMKRAAAAKEVRGPALPSTSAMETTEATTFGYGGSTGIFRSSTSSPRRGVMKAIPVGDEPLPPKGWTTRQATATKPLDTDWSVNLGTNAIGSMGMYPAKYSFSISTANCTDFVAYATGAAGSSSQPSIVAFDNLYAGTCSSVPTTYWAYNTGGTITTSPVLSLDGAQLAFAQNSGSSVASLVILKWKASNGTIAGPVTPSAQSSGAAYRSCSAPCSYSVTFSGSANDSASSVYYDYSSDSAYVGDDAGKLHKFTGVFSGSPVEVGSPWPVALNTSGEGLSSPVYDSNSGRVFVGDYLLSDAPNCANSTCGYLYAVTASTGAKAATSSQLDYIYGIVDNPVVDSAAGRVYVFVGADSGFQSSSSPCGSRVPCSGVFQFPTTFASGSGTEARTGNGYEFMMAGTFDNSFYSSANGASPTGNLYVIGNTGTANNTLYQIPITSNVMGTPKAGPAVATNYTNSMFTAGLGMTEIYNSGKDYIFTGALTYGAPLACGAGGCVMGFDVTSGSISASTAPTGATAETNGTTGIIIDNTTSTAGTSNIYYMPLASQACGTGGTGGCAIQISQAAP